MNVMWNKKKKKQQILIESSCFYVPCLRLFSFCYMRAEAVAVAIEEDAKQTAQLRFAGPQIQIADEIDAAIEDKGSGATANGK